MTLIVGAEEAVMRAWEAAKAEVPKMKAPWAEGDEEMRAARADAFLRALRREGYEVVKR